MPVAVDHHTFTLDEYHQMIETGILTEDDRVELINGEIIAMSPINSPNAATVDRISNFLKEKIGQSVIVRVQSPVQIPEHSEPEPDVMLLKPRDDFYASAHPQPSDVYLLIEVADSSLAIDREIKLPLYAAAGIAEVWIVNLVDCRIEVFRSPSEDIYQQTETAEKEKGIVVPHFSLTVRAEDLLGS